LNFLVDESIADPPEVFYLFVLSHGRRGGIILAEETVQGSNAEDCSLYTTKEVWEALSTIQILAECPKILFFAVIIVYFFFFHLK
jgi:type III secretion system FlhB-like substrate exporter